MFVYLVGFLRQLFFPRNVGTLFDLFKPCVTFHTTAVEGEITDSSTSQWKILVELLTLVHTLQGQGLLIPVIGMKCPQSIGYRRIIVSISRT